MTAVAVWCGSGPAVPPTDLELATEVGRQVALRGWTLVTGGSELALMGAVAAAARAAGGRTVGVIPRALVDLEVADHDCDELVVVDTMQQRKAEMQRRADAFLTLPGGLGTCEELFEVWCAGHLGLHTKPVVVCDPHGHYQGLWSWMRELSARGYLHPGTRDALRVEPDVAAALNACVGEQVVLVDGTGRPIGVADKATVHQTSTPRHLAFSCYGFDADGRVLITRRAATKRAFPSVWTGSCCGHPAPGEDLPDAVRRRFRSELGVEVRDLRLVLPEFSYRAVDEAGIEENELCPVFLATLDGDPTPAHDEVDAWEWWSWERFQRAAAAGELSPWAQLQAEQLTTIDDPRTRRPAPTPARSRGEAGQAGSADLTGAAAR